MNIYIAAKYGKRFELRDLADLLRNQGHEVTSRWIENGEETAMTAQYAAQMDIDDIDRADLVLFLAEPVGSLNTGGGRYFELGYALAMGKRLVAVQPGDPQPTSDGRYRSHEVVFLAHPAVHLVNTLDAAVAFITEEDRRYES